MILLESSEEFTESSFNSRHSVIRPSALALRSKNFFYISQTFADFGAIRRITFRARNDAQARLVVDGPSQHSSLQFFGLFLHGLEPLFGLDNFWITLVGRGVQDVLDVAALQLFPAKKITRLVKELFLNYVTHLEVGRG